MSDHRHSAAPNGRAISWDSPIEGIDTIVSDLRALRFADNAPSYAEIARRIRERRAARGVGEHEQPVARSTVYDCFRPDRKRLDLGLAVEIAAALGLPASDSGEWLRRCRAAQGIADAASVVRLRTPAPPEVAEFVGRDHELRSLAEDLRGGDACWVSGMPGSGKTQLALRVASAMKDAGDVDDALLVDLRGFQAEAPTTDPASVRDALLRHLGERSSVRSSAAAQQASLRRTLRARRILLILDDARDGAQVRGIVGASAGAAVLVTSRVRPDGRGPVLDDLVLKPLPPDDAVVLLERVAGAAVRQDRETAAALATVLGGLPLALGLTAARIRERPQWDMQDHLAFIARRIENARVDEQLSTALSITTTGLPEESARLLRLFAASTLSTLDESVATALLGEPPAVTAGALDALISHSLLTAADRGGWAAHALTRAYAADLSDEMDPPRHRAEALARLDEHLVDATWGAYAAVAARAGETPRPARFSYSDRPGDAADAERWLESRLPDLLSAAFDAPASGRPHTLIRLSEGLSWWLNLSGRYPEAIRLHEAAIRCADDLGDATAYANASLDVGQVYAQIGRPETALTHLNRAARLEGDLEDPGIRGLLLNMIGLTLQERGEHDAAIDHLRRAIAIHDDAGQTNRLLSCMVNLGVTLHDVGRYREELEVEDQAVEIAERAGHRQMLANLLVNRSEAHLRLDALDAAQHDAERGLALSDEVGFVIGIVVAENNLGEIAVRRGLPDRAAEHYRRAIGVAEGTGQAAVIAEPMIGLARALAMAGDLPGHEKALETATALTRDSGSPALELRLELARRTAVAAVGDA